MNKFTKKLLILSIFITSSTHPMLRITRILSKNFKRIKFIQFTRSYLTAIHTRIELLPEIRKSRSIHELEKPANEYLSTIYKEIVDFEETNLKNIEEIDSFIDKQLSLIQDVNVILIKHIAIYDDPTISKKLLKQINRLTQKINSLKSVKEKQKNIIL